MFEACYILKEKESEYNLSIQGTAIFSNLMGFKKVFNQFKTGKKVGLAFSKAKLVDHTFMEFLEHFYVSCKKTCLSLTNEPGDKISWFIHQQ